MIDYKPIDIDVILC